MAQQTRASATSTSRNLTPITGALLSALFALLGVLGLQGIPAAASPAAPTPVAAAAHQSPAPAAAIPPATSVATQADTRSNADDKCTTACGQQPRVGRATPGEWHTLSPGGVSVPTSLVLPLPEPGQQLPLSQGTFTPPQHSERHSGRGPPPSNGI
ncbi:MULTISPECIES: hypothetical protein [unclassified Streptomyces]|uniref:hypothetical protein n=1 Tax=unclassified Streptomyces TaxID=2593676 RepID=UPI0011814493|nr:MULTISPECIES: hypothetical protein [unclassified Streptomyces]TRO59817.1 hypothetical protein E4K73_32355 [Streptomyces sp. IB201691-2A2]